ncbi:hypothetical protein [Nocardiopsis sp. FR26]|uniref:hypothetical protein n=1 Tax=Nocardiopsis sp. FR26 TaxID=2605987 RepID=UPI001359CF3D|nr:hypothetical protein [Nocardiopsis sp. FR26]
MTITPHTPDTNRLTVETNLTTTVATALDIPTTSVQAAYFAAAGRAIITIPVTTSSQVERVSSKASQALTETGFGAHFFNNDDQGGALGRTDYRAQIVVNVR